jgi:putative FmdB family regulatory protein
MPMYDMQCRSCKIVYEVFTTPDDKLGLCPECGAVSDRVYLTIGMIRTSDDGGNHYSEMLEVVDKEGGKHCQDFLRHPNRGSYENWKKTEGIRHIEPGEKLIKPKEQIAKNKSKIEAKLINNFRKREAISVGGQSQ